MPNKVFITNTSVPKPVWNLIPLVLFSPVPYLALNFTCLETLWPRNVISSENFCLYFFLFIYFFSLIFSKKFYKSLTKGHVISLTKFLVKIGLFGLKLSVTSSNLEKILQNRAFYQKTSSTFFLLSIEIKCYTIIRIFT